MFSLLGKDGWEQTKCYSRLSAFVIALPLVCFQRRVLFVDSYVDSAFVCFSVSHGKIIYQPLSSWTNYLRIYQSK